MKFQNKSKIFVILFIISLLIIDLRFVKSDDSNHIIVSEEATKKLLQYLSYSDASVNDKINAVVRNLEELESQTSDNSATPTDDSADSGSTTKESTTEKKSPEEMITDLEDLFSCDDTCLELFNSMSATVAEIASKEALNTESASDKTEDEETKPPEDIFKGFEMDGYIYNVSITNIPDTIKIGDETYNVEEITDYKVDDFKKVYEIKVKVRDPETGEEKEITLNKEQIEKNKIKTNLTADLDWKDKIRVYSTSFKALRTAFNYLEGVFPSLKDTHNEWLGSMAPVISFLNDFSDLPSTICKGIYNIELENNEPGTRVMNKGGNAALFLDAKKQLVRTKDGEKVYYYRYSFGISPDAILKSNILNSDSSVKISVFAITDSGTTVYLNLNDDENREKDITLSEPYFYSNAVYYRTKKLDKLCMRYLGSLNDLNEDGLRFLRNDFCVDFHEIESAETTVELSGEEEEIY